MLQTNPDSSHVDAAARETQQGHKQGSPGGKARVRMRGTCYSNIHNWNCRPAFASFLTRTNQLMFIIGPQDVCFGRTTSTSSCRHVFATKSPRATRTLHIDAGDIHFHIIGPFTTPVATAICTRFQHPSHCNIRTEYVQMVIWASFI